MGIHFRSALIVAAAVGLLGAPSIASAATMEKLVQDGFKVSKLTNGKSGLPGWNLTKGDEKYFCPSKIGAVYVDAKKMFMFSTSGRPISMDRATYDAALGGPDSNIPYWKDVEVGKVSPAKVGPCLPTK